MGGKRRTVQNLKILKIDPTRDLLYVKGAVPGTNGNFVRVVDAVMGPFSPLPQPFPTFSFPNGNPAVLGEIDIELLKNLQLEAPAGEKDAGKFSPPEDPY